jgi:hypothetical protein
MTFSFGNPIVSIVLIQLHADLRHSARRKREERMDRTAIGWINGFLGVVIFSGSLPATRLAVHDFAAVPHHRRAPRDRRDPGGADAHAVSPAWPEKSDIVPS